MNIYLNFSLLYLKQENHASSQESSKETAPVIKIQMEETSNLPAQLPTQPLPPPPPTTIIHDKKTILKNAINQNEQIEKQSVLDEGDKVSLENMAIYNDSIDGTPPPSSQQARAKNKTKPKPAPRTQQETNTQPQQQPHQPFPFPKKSLAKEKTSKSNNNTKKSTMDKENEQQKQSKTNANTKNLALNVINKEPTVTSFKEDDQVLDKSFYTFYLANNKMIK